MAAETWSVTGSGGGGGRACDSCKAAPAAVFCRADAAFLCLACDGRVHAANKLASRHGRVWLCEVCEQAPAAVTCKADAAALCDACDRDIHSANPLARRHHRVPVAPFFDAIAERSFPASAEEFSEEEAEAASWLLPDAKPAASADDDDDTGSPEYKSEYLFSEMDPYLDLDLMISGDQNKQSAAAAEQQKQYSSAAADGVVPVQEFGSGYPGPVVDGYPSYDLDYHQPAGSKPFLYNFGSQTICQSVSSSSMEVGVVPDHNMMAADISDAFAKTEPIPTPVSGIDREARVLRYREKRKNRRFEKTIRYASRKAYAETRPRIKGRFAKRSELEVDSLLNVDASYGVVPSF